MQFNQYIVLNYENQQTGRPVIIYLFAVVSKFVDSSQHLKRLLIGIRKPSDVILVTNQPLKTYAARVIHTFKHIKTKTYLHENFDIVIPNAPLSYPHRILSHAEVEHLLNEELCCYLVNLPKITTDDVQCVWCGAEVGDVIEITAASDLAGETLQYRVVVPKSGRVVNFRDNPDAADNPDNPDDAETETVKAEPAEPEPEPEHDAVDHEPDDEEYESDEA